MSDMNTRFFVSIRKYRSNPLYTYIAPRSFRKNTTSTDLKKTLIFQRFWDRMFSIGAVSNFLATRLDREEELTIPITADSARGVLQLRKCSVQSTTSCLTTRTGSYAVRSNFEVTSGNLANAGYSLGVEFTEWDKDNFICAPGASYNGSRFERLKLTYPPFLPTEVQGKDIPVYTAGIPGLHTTTSTSQMDLLISEVTSPMIGIWFRKQAKCIWMTTAQAGAAGHNGFSVREDLEKRTLRIGITTPVVREPVSFHGSVSVPSWDKGCSLEKGDKAALDMSFQTFDCSSIDDFYRCFKEIQVGDHPVPVLAKKRFPLSATWDLIETLYNRDKWSEAHGYYHAGFIPPFIPADTWSAGWTGGLALSYALINSGNELSRERGLRNLEFFFSEGGQSDAGIFYATSDGVSWGGDNYFQNEHIGDNDWIHVRRCGDYLLLVIKHFELLEARGEGSLVRSAWREKIRKCADALCSIWDANQHFGQYINPNTLTIRIGNSDAGSIVPGALAACSRYFNEIRYLKVAEESLAFYHNDFLRKGYTTGGPLDILCAPDSESAFNLLESLMAVYEVTLNKTWLSKAHRYTDYIRTWFYTYDVKFPEGTIYERLGVQTTGSVMASSQNRCAVPNMCTLSGDSFWKLYRYTKDEHIMHLMQECMHNTQQYVSRSDNQILTMLGVPLSDGTIHECIQTGDWAGPMGEIPYEYPTSWTEVAQLLSIAEIPGIYLVADTAKLFVMDHLDVSVTANEEATLTLEISNRTAHDATTRLYVETEAMMDLPPAFDIGRQSVELHVPAGKSLEYVVSKSVPAERPPVRAQ